jgi:alkyldihydroxyacetonephosphate synthase
MTENNRWLHKWGFKDTTFVVNSDKSLTMTGNRYKLAGYKITKLLPYFEEQLKVKIDFNHSQAENENKIVLSANKNIPFCEAVSQSFNDNQYSFVDEDRLQHSHGQTSAKEVYKVLYHQLDRTVDMVLYSESENDVKTLIEIATKHNVCLIPYGGGTNVSCALKLPSNEARMIIAVDTGRMNRIEWIDKENLRACVQAGITGFQLEEELKKQGFTCGHEPDSMELSTLGGWIATNASGMKKNRYGNIEQIVENITMVTPSGILEQTQPLSRVSMGMQPQSLLFGSEGNLGIITKAVIKIHPLPQVQEYNSVIFPSFEHGLKFLNQLSQTGTVPASVRLVDNKQFRFAQALKPQIKGIKALLNKLTEFYIFKIRGFNPQTMVAATLVFEGSQQEVAYQKATINSLAKQNQGLIAGGKNGRAGYMLTFAIAYIRDLLFNFHILGETFETTVPWSQIQQLCNSVEAAIEEEHKKHNLPGKPYLSYRITQLYHTSVCIYFTHAMYAKGIDNPENVLSKIEHSLREIIIKNGGSISHHHGVGKLRSSFMKEMISSTSIDLLKKMKHGIDPSNIFGVKNNVFDS